MDNDNERKSTTSSSSSLSEIKTIKWSDDGSKTIHNNSIIDEIPLIPNPIFSFDKCQFFGKKLLKKINDAKFEKPTPIQSQAFTMIMNGSDVIGIAQTGSGKTLSFVLPGIHHINYQKKNINDYKICNQPRMCIVAPTRELAIQIDNEISKFCPLKHTCVYGGSGNRFNQIASIESGIEIVVGTPGRMIDFVENKILDLNYVTYLVIDEADRLLDMGFEVQLSQIVSQIRPDKQMILTSATWPKEVINMAKKFLTKSNNIFQVIIGDIELTTNTNITQQVKIFDNDYNKKKHMCKMIDDVLKIDQYAKILLFCTRKKLCDNVGNYLWNNNYYVDIIHSGKNQRKREELINQFKNKELNILVATDVASRGIDIKDIKLVINYDPPLTIEDYVHRIGRTGRAGDKGKAIQFLSKDDDVKFVKQLFWVLKKNGQKHALTNELLDLTKMKGVPGWEI